MSAAPLKPDLAFELRCKLAVRSWVGPADLVQDLGAKRAEHVLNQVASEVETSFSDHPGQWYLTTDARRRVLGLWDNDDLARSISADSLESDSTDPLLAAFRYTMGVRPQPVAEQLSDEILKALPLVASWLGGAGDAPIEAETASVLLQARARMREIERMTFYPLVGAVHNQLWRELGARLMAPPAGGISINYVHGLGGSGKSTLLSFIERDLLADPRRRGVVRLDFDDPLVDALDPTSLDLAMISSLSTLDRPQATYYSWLRDQLRTIRLAQSDQPTASSQAARREAKIRLEYAQSADSAGLESASLDTAAGRDSILYGLFSRALPDQPLVLLLDTAELAIARGEAAMVELGHWLQSLVRILGAREVRVLIAGRDPPDAALLDRLRFVGRMDSTVELPELSVAEGTELLELFGVKDHEVALAAAKAVPCNPLLLRLTAEALLGDPELAEEVHQAHRTEQVDSVTARKYLSRRILAHLASRDARPYLLASMLLPMVTRSQLSGIVLPEVDGELDGAKARAERVFRGLAGARWLTRQSADRKILYFHPDIRMLVVGLLRADPESAKAEIALRHRAIRFHESRSAPRDRAFAFYHRAKLGEDLAQPRNPSRIISELGPVFAELPEKVRALLLNSPRRPIGRISRRRVKEVAASLQRAMEPDEDWRRRLEGDGKLEGEGDRLLKRDRAAEALELYRDRPTREKGVPPTFVLRALTDLAQWDTGEVQVEAILDESVDWFKARRFSGPAMSRIYWLTRFALVRDAAKLSPRHLDILARACEHVAGASLTTMPAIVAVAEAGSGRPIMPDRMRSGRGKIESETRVHLVHALQTRTDAALQPNADALIVTQRDWLDRIREARGIVLNPQWLASAQEAVQSLHGRPIAALGLMLRAFKNPIPLRWRSEDREAGILMLRGVTGEFNRPLRQVIVQMLDDDHEVRKRALEIITSVTAAMSVRPLEFDDMELAERLERDPAAWCSGFISFADRSRLLPHLCHELSMLKAETKPVTVAKRVARSFLGWDEAICGGGTSGWAARQK